MISSHGDHFSDHTHFCQTDVIQQGSGPHPYGVASGTTVVVHHGRRRIKGKGYVALGAFLLVASFVLLICGALFVTGAIGGSYEFSTPVSMALFGFGGMTLLMGLCFIIPSARYEMKKNKQQQQQPRTGDHPSSGPDQPRFNPPRQPYDQPSYQPFYQQGSNIPPQAFQPNPPSTNPPPYTWSSPAAYSNAGFTSSAGPKMGYTKAN